MFDSSSHQSSSFSLPRCSTKVFLFSAFTLFPSYFPNLSREYQIYHLLSQLSFSLLRLSLWSEVLGPAIPTLTLQVFIVLVLSWLSCAFLGCLSLFNVRSLSTVSTYQSTYSYTVPVAAVARPHPSIHTPTHTATSAYPLIYCKVQ